MNTQIKPFQIYLLALILIEAILSAYTAYANTSGTGLCFLGESCTTVQNSVYGQFLGIKISIWGAIAFLLLAGIYYMTRSHYPHYKWYFSAVLLGTLAALAFIAIQFFVLKQLCSSCIIIDTLMLAVAALSAYEFYQLKKYY